jgi:hypothetical protein
MNCSRRETILLFLVSECTLYEHENTGYRMVLVVTGRRVNKDILCIEFSSSNETQTMFVNTDNFLFCSTNKMFLGSEGF